VSQLEPHKHIFSLTDIPNKSLLPLFFFSPHHVITRSHPMGTCPPPPSPCPWGLIASRLRMGCNRRSGRFTGSLCLRASTATKRHRSSRDGSARACYESAHEGIHERLPETCVRAAAEDHRAPVPPPSSRCSGAARSTGQRQRGHRDEVSHTGSQERL